MEMLGMMHMLCHQRNNANKIVMTIVKSEKYLFLLYQNPGVSKTEYLRCFKELFIVVHTEGVISGRHPGLSRGEYRRYHLQCRY